MTRVMDKGWRFFHPMAMDVFWDNDFMCRQDGCHRRSPLTGAVA